MFRASSAHPQEVNDVNCTCMQPLVFSFSKSELLLYCTVVLLYYCIANFHIQTKSQMVIIVD